MEFVTFEIAKKLKESGFNEPCYMYYHIYDNSEDSIASLECTGGDSDFVNSYNTFRCAAPTISQVLKWLRNEKEIYCLPHFDQSVDMWFGYVTRPKTCCVFVEYISGSIYNTYEDAALDGIEYVLDNLI